jgi:hypothetical protein
VQWQLVLDTLQDVIPAHAPLTSEGKHYDLKGRSLALMQIEAAVPIRSTIRGFPGTQR